MASISILGDFDHQRVLLSAICVLIGLGILAICKRHKASNPAVQDSNNKSISTVIPEPPQKSPLSPQRKPGAWSPVLFDYPAVEPCADNPTTIKPVPYRPFRWGEYHVTMGIRSMPWNDWFELDDQFSNYHHIRERRIQAHGDRLVRVLPSTPQLATGGHDAAGELVQEMAEYLSRRYSTTYTVKRVGDPQRAGGWYGLPPIQEITIVPVGKTYNLETEDPMVVAALLVQDDIAIMIEGSDGRYYLQAAAILIPGSWRLQDKIGMSLDEIHISGTVPQFESKLQLSMSRFFRRLPVDKPVCRTNYGFQVVAPPDLADPIDPHELAWARTMKGEETSDDEIEPGFMRPRHSCNPPPSQVDPIKHVPTIFLADSNPDSTTPLSVHPSRVRMRVERQTLRRLPRTGAVVFGIRTYLTPLDDLASEPDVPGRLASAIRSWPEDVAVYKARPAYESVLSYLDAQHAAQVAASAGLTSVSDPVPIVQ